MGATEAPSRHRTRFLRRLAAIACCVSLASFACGSKSGGRVVVLGIDGLDPATIDLMLSEGKLPNFAKLRREGAYGRLLSSEPILSPIIWTTIATGKHPSEHRIGHFVAVNQTTGEQLPVTSRMRAVKALWNIVSDAGKNVDVVGWWATWPAETVRGTVVSDHTCYHFLFDKGGTGATDRVGIISPAEQADEILAMVKRPGDLGIEELRRYVSVSHEDVARPFHFDDDLSQFKWALATAHSYTDIGLHLWKTKRPDLLMVYIEGVDSTSHLFGHLFRARDLAGELARQQQQYGSTVERMYELADEIIGRYLAELDSDTTLVVLSDHGFQLGELQADPSKTRDMRRVSERYHSIEGVLYLYGRAVKPGARISGATLVDIAPTLLSLAGLLPASDMPGRVLTDGLTLSAPIDRVASYESTVAASAPSDQSSDIAPVDNAILERLRALGYLDTASPTGDRNLASLQFAQGRFAEAAAAYRELVETTPQDGSLRASLAGALGALGDYDGALAELDTAEKLSPLNPEIYHNRAVIQERQGRTAEAIEQYRRALRYSPEYEPSRTALKRLTGSTEAGGPKTAEEKQAAAIAERASNAARRGDYAAAMRELDEAERIAPRFALVYQYRANVAFLMGDRPRAVEALRKALAIEPDNALYASNLKQLESAPDTAGSKPGQP